MAETTKKKEMSQQERNWGMFAHLSALSMFIGVPFGNIIGPLLIWLIKKDEFSFVAQEGKEALNFQISITIYYIVAGILCVVFIGFILLAVLAVAQIILIITASVKASEGSGYQYPYSIKFVQ